MMNQLIERCVYYMEENGCIVDPAEDGYSVEQLCRSIGEFMDSEGFGMPNRESFTYPDNL